MADPSTQHLHARLEAVEQRVAEAVLRFRQVDSNPDDGFRGLYVSDEHADDLLDGSRRQLGFDVHDTGELVRLAEEGADQAEAAGADLRLRRLQKAFGLAPLDVEILLVAMLPDIDRRFEKLYGYLHDDVTRRRASPGLALELSGVSVADGRSRAHVSPGARLFERGLLVLDDDRRPFLTRALRVPDRVTAHVLGDDTPDALVIPGLVHTPPVKGPLADQLARVLGRAAPLAYLRQRSDLGASGVAKAAFAAIGLETMVFDVAILVEEHDPFLVVEACAREARLRGAGLVIEGIDALEPWAIRRLSAEIWPTTLIGSAPWDPKWSARTALSLDVTTDDVRAANEPWRAVLEGLNVDVGPLVEFRLGPRQIEQAVSAAHAYAIAFDRPLGVEDLAAGARSQNSAGLEKLARRIRPAAGWSDMVLRHETSRQLDHLASRVAHRTQVLDGWGFRRGGSRGEGITALFAGESGTGKTMAAEVIAGDLGLDLYVIDLATVVDKYIGETEKNLDRIFSQAEGVNGVLFFDEADALFGNRSEVNDARDRYANVEVAYLLQRMETFDGLAVLASNLRANIDEAFMRRISVTIDFPSPDDAERRKLWDVCLGAVPRADDLDLDFCAEAFELSGGNIRNIAVAAAYLAASDAQPVTMAHLIRATGIEYHKLGRLCVEAEFGAWFEVVDAVG